MSDPIPAVSESAAIGPIADIFADIRRVLGVQVVNLIWRHLATLPGALPWAWETLRPLYADGTLAAEAQLLHGQLALPRLPRFPPELLAAVDLADGDITSIRDILAAYDRTNAMALLALSALVYRLEGRPPSLADQGASGSVARAPEAMVPIPLPPLPGLNELREPVTNLVVTLNRLGTRRENPVLASMYRHLAYWPAYLALSWALIAPLDADGSLDRAIVDFLEKAQPQAAGLAARLREPALDAVTVAAIRSAADSFAGDVIAKMVVICALLRKATQRGIEPPEGKSA
jgi:hypothetical protein